MFAGSRVPGLWSRLMGHWVQALGFGGLAGKEFQLEALGFGFIGCRVVRFRV